MCGIAIVALTGSLLTGCLSRPAAIVASSAPTVARGLATAANLRTSTTPAAARDPRLFGTWRVKSARVTGHDVLTADDATTASLTFRRDGLLVVNAQECGAPHFAAAHGGIDLQWPTIARCFEDGSATPRAARIAGILETLIRRSPLTYTFDGTAVLTVQDARLHVDLVRGRVPVVPEPTPGPSSPAPYSGTDVTSPPR